ncbi:hypothetical protein D3C78_1967560 [compost metagenome]
MKSRVEPTIQGPKKSRATKTATIFGMKVSVISLIWVTAWKTEMARPTTRLIKSVGPAS